MAELNYAGIERIRATRSDNVIYAQQGGQEDMLSADVDILIGGGSRGGAKSFSLLLEGLYDCKNPFFNAVIVRKEKGDLESLVNDSYKVYSQFGNYNRSINDMTWNFKQGGWLKFSYYDGAFADFKDRFQGRQYAFIGIDEITQCSYEKFKYLLTTNRNAHHLRSRIWGTCNPDPDSWVRKFIDWWIGEDGYAIPERNGVVRYCYMDGDSPENIYWGNTPDEVYKKCQHIIDDLWKEEYAQYGYDRITMFIKSVAFVRADVSENKKLMESDPSYLANLAQQDEGQRFRDLQANWNRKISGKDFLSEKDMLTFFATPSLGGDDKGRYASCDVAFTGGDNLVLWLWEGFHVKDVLVLRQDARIAADAIKKKLTEWGVHEQNFTYDMNGLGQAFKGFFKNAIPFNNMGAPIAAVASEQKGVRYLYKDLKSQCAFLFAEKLKEGEISIEPDLLERTFSGAGYSGLTLREILLRERKAIRNGQAMNDRGFCLPKKKEMKRIVGWSPDFIEGLLYRMIFTVKSNHKKPKGLWMF